MLLARALMLQWRLVSCWCQHIAVSTTISSRLVVLEYARSLMPADSLPPILQQKRTWWNVCTCQWQQTCTHTHAHLTAFCPGLPGWAVTRKVKPIWILLKQETVSGSGISWAICKSSPCSRQITTPAPHHSVFYRPDALPAAQPTASKHWRHNKLADILFKHTRTAA